MLPIGSKYEEEDIINFLVVDLGTGRVIGCNEKCGELYGIYPHLFKSIQDFDLLAQQLFKDFDKIVTECSTSRFRMNQQFAKLEKRVPELVTFLETSYLKEIYIQAKNQEDNFKNQKSLLQRNQSQDLDYSQNSLSIEENLLKDRQQLEDDGTKAKDFQVENAEFGIKPYEPKNSEASTQDQAFFDRFRSTKVKV